MGERIIVHDGETVHGYEDEIAPADPNPRIVVVSHGGGIKTTLKDILENGYTVPHINVPEAKYGEEITESSIIDRTFHKMILNPNVEEASRILFNIYDNHGYCPSKSKETIEDTRCPCNEMLTHQKCQCRLFVREDEL